MLRSAESLTLAFTSRPKLVSNVLWPAEVLFFTLNLFKSTEMILTEGKRVN